MIGARNLETATLLQKQFADRKTKKTYLAITAGIPKLDMANIDLPINRNPSKPSTFRVDSNGKPAVTKYKVIDSTDKYALILLQPQTGRTHQLRVHMNYLNTPILGDKVYGKPAKRLYLHAYSLEITIPSGNRQTFIAPVPSDFNEFFAKISL
jgi:23S rRNA pseudouridine1911/1915/1917 synthase